MKKLVTSVLLLMLTNYGYSNDHVGSCNSFSQSVREKNNADISDPFAKIHEFIKSEKNELFQTLFTVLADIPKYQATFNDQNDKYKLAYTFSLLKSFANLNEMEIDAKDIKAALNIATQKWNFEVPQMALDILDKIGSIKTIHYPDGRSSIKLISKNGKPTIVDLSNNGPDNKKSNIKLKQLKIQNGAEISFITKDDDKFDRKANSFFGRSLITKTKNLITENEANNILNFLHKNTKETEDTNNTIKPAYIDMSGMTIYFDLKGEKIDHADLSGGIIIPGIKDQANKDKPNFYVGLSNIDVNFLVKNMSAEIPM